MNFFELGPCTNAQYSLQLVIALGVMMNTALASWLAHRRLMADRRENGHGPKSSNDSQLDRDRRDGDVRDDTGRAERR